MMIPLGGVLLLRNVMMQGPGDFREKCSCPGFSVLKFYFNLTFLRDPFEILVDNS